MTPTKRGDVTTVKIERIAGSIDKGRVALEGSGEHRGIVINKQVEEDEGPTPIDDTLEVTLEFRCYLVSGRTGKTTVENRRMSFAYGNAKADKRGLAQNFFRELLRSEQFPRDYVGFIKRMIKQLQTQPDFAAISAIECEFSPVNLTEQMDLNYEDEARKKAMESQPAQLVCKEALLRALESAYPNVLTFDNLLEMCNGDRAQLEALLKDMKGLDLIDEVQTEGGPGGRGGPKTVCFRRKVLQLNTEVREIKQISQLNALNTSLNQKPTIGIITAQYCEKLAMDAMMSDKTTFVRYKTDGESTVYTVGSIGKHKVVCTKLPVIGRDRSAMISASNQTTRLCGIFQDIEHVFLVGVAGGVPHYADFYKHSRRGDIVVSAANTHGHMYVYCEKITERVEEEKPADHHPLTRPHPRAGTFSVLLH